MKMQFFSALISTFIIATMVKSNPIQQTIAVEEPIIVPVEVPAPVPAPAPVPCPAPIGMPAPVPCNCPSTCPPVNSQGPDVIQKISSIAAKLANLDYGSLIPAPIETAPTVGLTDQISSVGTSLLTGIKGHAQSANQYIISQSNHALVGLQNVKDKAVKVGTFALKPIAVIGGLKATATGVGLGLVGAATTKVGAKIGLIGAKIAGLGLKAKAVGAGMAAVGIKTAAKSLASLKSSFNQITPAIVSVPVTTYQVVPVVKHIPVPMIVKKQPIQTMAVQMAPVVAPVVQAVQMTSAVQVPVQAIHTAPVIASMVQVPVKKYSAKKILIK